MSVFSSGSSPMSVQRQLRLELADLDAELSRDQTVLLRLKSEQASLIRELHETQMEEQRCKAVHREHQMELQEAWVKLSTLRGHIAHIVKRMNETVMEEAKLKSSLSSLISKPTSNIDTYLLTAKVQRRDELAQQIEAQEKLLEELRSQISTQSSALVSTSSAGKSLQESLLLRESLRKASFALEDAEREFLDMNTRMDSLKKEIKDSFLNSSLRTVLSIPQNSSTDLGGSSLNTTAASSLSTGSGHVRSDLTLHEVLSGHATLQRLNGEHVTVFRSRLEKRHQTLLHLEKQLQSDLDENAVCVRRSKDEARDAELRYCAH